MITYESISSEEVAALAIGDRVEFGPTIAGTFTGVVNGHAGFRRVGLADVIWVPIEAACDECSSTLHTSEDCPTYRGKADW